jgi:hypothetical protein
MKYNVDSPLVGFNGNAIVQSEQDPSPITLKDTLMMACVNANLQKHSTGEEKLKIYRLLQALNAGGQVELNAEQVTLLKNLVGDAYGPAVVGSVYDALEQTAEQ